MFFLLFFSPPSKKFYWLLKPYLLKGPPFGPKQVMIILKMVTRILKYFGRNYLGLWKDGLTERNVHESARVVSSMRVPLWLLWLVGQEISQDLRETVPLCQERT